MPSDYWFNKIAGTEIKNTADWKIGAASRIIGLRKTEVSKAGDVCIPRGIVFLAERIFFLQSLLFSFVFV